MAFGDFLQEFKFENYYKYILEKLKGKKILIYGAGTFFNYVFTKYDFSTLEILAISDKKFEGESVALYNGYKVVKPKDINTISFDAVLVCTQEYNNIIQTLKALVSSADIQFIPLSPKRAFKQIQWLLTDHCNMKCIACSHFSSIAKPNFLTLEDYKKDLYRLKELFHEIAWFSFVGGEPLLNKDLAEMLILARENFPKSNVCIITNGLLIKAMSDELWEVVRKNNVQVQITAYPALEDELEVLKSYLIAKGVTTILYSYERLKDGKINFFKRYNTDGSMDINESFVKCFSKNCHTLHKGLISGCYFPHVVDIANQEFGLNIQGKESSVLNIHAKDICAADIIDFCNAPIPLCKYCDTQLETVEWCRLLKPPYSKTDFFVRQ